MPSNNPTPGIKELAEKLGLSKATVSKALNGYSQVNAQTRQRVLNAAEEMGYSLPETEARSARKKRIGWIYATASHETSISQLSVSSGFQVASQQHYGNEMELILLRHAANASAPAGSDYRLSAGRRIHERYSV